MSDHNPISNKVTSKPPISQRPPRHIVVRDDVVAAKLKEQKQTSKQPLAPQISKQVSALESRGKRPIQERKDPAIEFAAEFDEDITKLNSTLVKEIDAKGLVPRWVDYLRMKDMDGYHKKGWELYKRTPGATISNQEARMGRNPDGLVRRGTLVLVVRTKEFNEKHKVYLRDRASKHVTNSRKQQADSLRRQAAQYNMDSQVTEGYDEK